MSAYSVKTFTGEYSARNAAANKWGAKLKIDFHENAGSSSARYTLMEYTNPHAAGFAQALSNAVSVCTGQGAVGHVKYLRSGERGHVCVGGFTGWGIVFEPLFVSNKYDLAWLSLAANRLKLAAAVVGVIRRYYPKGAKVALSLGHKGKPSAPNDRGAAAGKYTEAYFAEMVMKQVELLLIAAPSVSVPTPAPKRDWWLVSFRTKRTGNAGLVDKYARCTLSDVTLMQSRPDGSVAFLAHSSGGAAIRLAAYALGKGIVCKVQRTSLTNSDANMRRVIATE